MKTAISLFAGAVDGLSIAAQAAGIKVTHHVEWDAWCCRVLRMNHPDSIVIHEDIHNVHNLPPADIIFGGSPCQDFSVAGARAGFSGERYLWPEMFRIVRENRPSVVIHENVRGGVSAGLLDRICDDLESADYETTALVFPANVFGAPHERYRMFVIGLLAYSQPFRRQGTAAKPDTDLNQQQHLSTSEQSRRTVPNAVESGCQDVGNTKYKGLYESIQANGRTDTTQDHRGMDNRLERSSSVQQPGGLLESKLDRVAHGTSARIHGFDPLTDFPGWPAGQGVYQHAYEPPRTTAKKGQYAKERIQALGNAVVWQQAAPIFKAVARWLEGQATS